MVLNPINSKSSMNIKHSYEKIKQGAPEFEWDKEELNKVIEIANGLKRSDLVIFWLQDAAGASEESFNSWFKSLEHFSKQEIIDIIHEIGPEAGKRFIEKFGREQK